VRKKLVKETTPELKKETAPVIVITLSDIAVATTAG